LLGAARRAARKPEQHAGGVAQVDPALLPLLRRGGDALVLVVGEHGLEHVRRRDLATSDGRQHVLDVLAREAVQGRLEGLPGERLAGPFEGTLEDAHAETGILLADGEPRGATNGGARLAG